MSQLAGDGYGEVRKVLWAVLAANIAVTLLLSLALRARPGADGQLREATS